MASGHIWGCFHQRKALACKEPSCSLPPLSTPALPVAISTQRERGNQSVLSTACRPLAACPEAAVRLPPSPTLLHPAWCPGRLPCGLPQWVPWLLASCGSSQQGAIAGDWRTGEETGQNISRTPTLLPSTKAATASTGCPSSNKRKHTCCPFSPGVSQLSTVAGPAGLHCPCWLPLT